MIRSVPILACALLAACDAPLEEFWPPERMTIEKDEKTYVVRTQRDPINLTWFTFVTTPTFDLTEEDRYPVIQMVLTDVAAKVCEGGGTMALSDSEDFFTYKSPVRHMPTRGAWKIVSHCV